MGTGDEWEVYDYERNMGMTLVINQLADENRRKLPWELQNATIESLVLHTRVLTDILISKSKEADDITLEKLLPRFKSSRIATLKQAYGDAQKENCPCWQFNKMLAHATVHRSTSHEYLPALRIVWEHVAPLLDEIEAARQSMEHDT